MRLKYTYLFSLGLCLLYLSACGPHTGEDLDVVLDKIDASWVGK